VHISLLLLKTILNPSTRYTWRPPYYSSFKASPSRSPTPSITPFSTPTPWFLPYYVCLHHIICTRVKHYLHIPVSPTLLFSTGGQRPLARPNFHLHLLDSLLEAKVFVLSMTPGKAMLYLHAKAYMCLRLLICMSSNVPMG
jgi:hypothetical protein